MIGDEFHEGRWVGKILDFVYQHEQLAASLTALSQVCAFLLQNLRRHGTAWSWQINFDVLARPGTGPAGVAGWPTADATAYPPFRGPVAWVAGAESTYITDRDAEPMRALFPRVTQVTVKDAGHWVHSDDPDGFVTVVRHFLTDYGDAASAQRD